MAHMTNFLENKLIDWFFRGQAIGITGASAAAGTGPTSLYFGLLTATPSDTGGGTEVSTTNTAYARQAVTSSLTNWAGTQAAASTVASSGTTGTTSNNNAITFPTPQFSGGVNWGTVVAMGIYDAVTGGNLLFWAPLAANKTINVGDAAPSFAAATLSIQIDD